MDLISVLGKLHASGDDTLGIYHMNAGDRMKVWGKQGVFWGGLWGMIAGAAGLFMIPGVGAVERGVPCGVFQPEQRVMCGVAFGNIGAAKAHAVLFQAYGARTGKIFGVLLDVFDLRAAPAVD